MSFYEMDPRVKLRGIFKTKKHIDLRLMALAEKITEIALCRYANENQFGLQKSCCPC